MIMKTKNKENKQEWGEEAFYPYSDRLFITTYDGVKKYMGDPAYRVKLPVKEDDADPVLFTIDFKCMKEKRCDENIVFFDSYERAKQYQEENIPVFSRKEILEVLYNLSTELPYRSSGALNSGYKRGIFRAIEKIEKLDK